MYLFPSLGEHGAVKVETEGALIHVASKGEMGLELSGVYIL